MDLLVRLGLVPEKPKEVEFTARRIPITLEDQPVKEEPEKTTLDMAKELFKLKMYVEQLIAGYDRYALRRNERRKEMSIPERRPLHANNVDVEKYLDPNHKTPEAHKAWSKDLERGSSITYPLEGIGNRRAVKIGQYREPRAGEYYLSGAIPTAYLAKNNLTTKFHIAKVI